MNITRIKNDANGNGRLVVHFLTLCTRKEMDTFEDIGIKYVRALARARKIGGRKFHNKQYGGGIVFTNYESNLREEIERLIADAQAKGE